MKNYFDIKDKVAVITGGSSGLGFQIGKAYADQGAKVVLLARREDRLKENVAEIKETYGVDASYEVVDVTDYANVEAAAKNIIDEYGRVDILVNCAGRGFMAPVLEQPVEEWDKDIAIDLTGVFYCCKAFGEYMVKQNYGKIINMGSIHSRVALTGGLITGYVAAKGGVFNLTKTLAAEWAPYNITVNAIGPAYFESELTADVVGDEQFDMLIKAFCPMGRWGKEGELDGIAIYLASDASSFCTGQLINIDGGWTAI